MKNVGFGKWALSLLVVAGMIIAAGTVQRLAAQDQHEGHKAAAQGDKAAKEKARAEHLATLRKAFADAKTTLAQAITAAETEAKGKAYAAEFEVQKDGKAEYHAYVMSGEKIQVAIVDPMTGKVTKVKEHGDHDEDDDDDDRR